MHTLRGQGLQVSIFFTVRRVLVVDDEENIRLVLRTLLKRHGYEVEAAPGGEEALGLVESFGPDVVITDVRMPRMGGMDLLSTLRAKGNDATVIVMSAYGNLDQAIDAIKAGAYDYIQKPFKPDEIVLALRKAEERESLRRENRALREEIRREHKFEDILAKSSVMQGVFRTIAKISNYKTTVLVTGESGVGKELVARALHSRSGRAGKAFVPVNCGAIPENLLESELFGHKKGAFTDAVADRNGLFTEADGGTLFLDEIGELPLGLQVKLLRVLEDGKIRRLGETKDVAVDVRIVAATHRDLLKETQKGRFREDLFYRLNVLPIHVPPLRERREDIPVLAQHFLHGFAQAEGLADKELTPDAAALLENYSWPGNVRELRNLMERTVILVPGPIVHARDIADWLVPVTRTPPAGGAGEGAGDEDGDDLPAEAGTLREELERREADAILKVLEGARWNVTQAAAQLGVDRTNLHRKMRKYGIRRNSREDEA